MTQFHLIHSGGAFVVALLIGIVGMPLANRIGHRLGMVVHPRLFGAGPRAVPYLGGAAVAVTVSFVFAGSLFFVEGLARETAGLLLGSLALLAFGLLDDGNKREGPSPLFRIVVEAVIATWVWWAGLRATPTGIEWLDAGITIFFLVSVTNAFNLLDNMDGVAGACAATIAGGLFILAILGGQHLVAVLAVSILGASLAFLPHNLDNPRLYLGNGGALFLGFLLAATTLKLRLPLPPPLSFLGAIAVLAVPVTDTSLVLLSRLLARRSPFVGAVDHLSHRLVLLGFSTQACALTHATGSAVGALVVAVAVVTQQAEPVLGAILAYAVIGLWLLRVPIYDVGTEAHLGSHPRTAGPVR